jgi:HlyD family secretion protein
MMRITMGRILVALAALVAAASVVWSLMSKPVTVEIALVTKGRFAATIDEDGKTRIRERFLVAAPLAGRLTRVQLKAGDRIALNEAIATIVPAPAPFLDARARREAEERVGIADAALERSRAAVERAQAQTEQANSEYARTRALVDRGVSTAQALERAELAQRLADRDLRAAQFQLDASGHELAQARTLLSQYHDGEQMPRNGWTVTSPVAGVVLRVSQESETIILPGAPIVEIGNLRDLEIVVDVLSNNGVEIRPGAVVAIENWGGRGPLVGAVRHVEPAAFTKVSTLGVEEQRVNVVIDIVSSPEQWLGLGDGFQIDARIEVYALDQATIIPAGALFRRGESWTVFVVENGRAKLRPVKLLRRSGRVAAIAEGVEAGERVIVYPGDRVTPDARIEAR